MNAAPILRAESISKSYPGVRALDCVDFDLAEGEVRALVGKNGAGKSTFVKILSGATQADSGAILIGGERVAIRNPADAFASGIATVYQEMSLILGLTVAENILLGHWPMRRRLGIQVIDMKETVRAARESLEMMELTIDPKAVVRSLSLPQRQMVEIAKAIATRPKVLILDEPTSALPAHEVDELLALVRRLAGKGVAVVYVSHRLQELPRVADSLTVFRDGRQVDTLPIAQATPERIVRMMIGSEWKRRQTSAHEVTGEVRLAVANIERRNRLHDISFELHSGEVLGIAGLLGSGRTELLRTIMGLDPADAGCIFVDGARVHRPSPLKMKRLGVGMTPEDRKSEGIVSLMSVGKNLTLSCLDKVSWNSVISLSRERLLAQSMATSLSIKAPGMDVEARSLSGGNQQKLVIGKWLNSQVRILLMDEPTRGIDIEAKNQVYDLVRDLAAEGMSVIFVSSEMDEVMEVSDRIIVLNGGRIAAIVNAADATIERLLTISMSEAR